MFKREETAPTRRNDVTFFIPSLRAGGAEQAIIRLANWCSARGLMVDLLVLSDEGPLGDQVRGNVNLVSLGRRRAALALFPLRRYLRDNTPRLLVASMSHLNVISILARGTNPHISVMLLEHRDVAARALLDRGWKERFILFMMHWVYPAAHQIAAVSEGAARSLASTLELPRRRVAVLPNSVDVARLRQSAETSATHPWLLEDDERPLVIAVGRLVPVKGFVDLLHAFTRLRKKRDARLVIIGEGPQRQELEDLRDRLGLEDVVDFHGYMADPLPLVARSDVFVLSSHSEGQGMVLLEAMAAGTPIVATDCPSGPRELLQDGEAGLLVPVGDAEAMANAIDRLLSDDVLRNELIKAGRARVEQFDIDVIGPHFLSLWPRKDKPQNLA